MEYFTSTGNLITLDGMRTSYCGQCGEIIKDKKTNQTYKKYFYDTDENSRLSYVMFKFLKSIDSQHLVNIKEVLYHAANVGDVDYFIRNVSSYVIDGYLYDWIEKSDKSILDFPISYILINMFELFCLGERFTEKGIFLPDIKADNAVVTKSGIVIIDPDAFFFARPPIDEDYNLSEEVDYDYIAYYNNNSIKELFIELVYQAAMMRQIDTGYIEMEDFFKDINDKDKVSLLSKRLEGYSTLDTYFN